MSKAMQLVGIILLGIFTLVIVYLMSDARSTNELDYYLLQEVTEASMYDAVDYSYYRETGLLKVDRDMFLENFNRRFAESVTANREYEIKIIDFNETPPKVSVEVKAPTVASVKGEVALITNRVSGIIETIYDDYVYSKGDYMAGDFDESAPTIVFTDKGNDKYSVLIADDLYISGYKVIQMNNNNKNSASTICSTVNDWDSPGRWATTYVFEQTLTANDSGYWIAAIDGSNNCAVRPLSDIAPWLNLNYDPLPSNTYLTANLYDDHGLSKYYIAPSDWSTSDVINRCSGNSSVCKSVSIGDKAVVNTDGYYTYSFSIQLNKQGLNYGTYRLFVVDNKNRITMSTENLVLKESHKPNVSYAYVDANSNSGTLTLTFSDRGNDLYGYKYSTSNNTPVNDTDYSSNWVSTSDGMRVTLNNITDGTYYIWAKDKQNEITKMTLNIDLETINKTVDCHTGGTLIENNTKCHYEKNESQCDKTGYGCSSCYTYSMKNGACNSWGEASCQNVTKKCTIKTYQCGPHVEKFASSNSNGINAFKSTCEVQGYSVNNVRTDNNVQDSRCGTELVCGDPPCLSYQQVKDESTCRYGCDGYTANSCDKDAIYNFTCPDGYTSSNNKACFKISAS